MAVINTSQQQPKRGNGCLWVALSFVGLCLVACILGLLALVTMRASFDVSVAHHHMGADEFPDLKEVWAYGSGDTKVVSIPLHGMIMLGENDDGLFSSINSAQMALLSIRRATHDPDVQALLLRVDSGGGGITASDVLYKALQDFKDSEPRRRVIAVFGDVAASGAYYVSLAADHIIAHPTTITGSIGVLIQTFNAQELGQKIGIKDVTVKSGKNKDILNPLGQLTEEQREMLQELVDELHARFVGLVAEGRKLSPDSVRALADGRIYSARQAMELGLVDELGYWEDGVANAARLLGVDQVKVYRYEQEFSFSAFFKSFQNFNPVQRFLHQTSQPRLMYLWTL